MVNLQSSGFSENFQTFILTVTDYVVPVLVLVDYVFQNSKWPPVCPLSKCSIWPQGTAGWRKLVRADSYLACEQALLFGRVKQVSRVLARLASLAQIGELARWLIPPDPAFDVSCFADFRSAFLSFARMSKCLSIRLSFCVLLSSIHHHFEGILRIYRWHRPNIYNHYFESPIWYWGLLNGNSQTHRRKLTSCSTSYHHCLFWVRDTDVQIRTSLILTSWKEVQTLTSLGSFAKQFTFFSKRN